MAKEIEVKLKVLGEGLEAFKGLQSVLAELGLVAEFESKSLQNAYFDTPDQLLNKHCMALRIRKKSELYIQTLKTKGVSVDGLSERGEWERSLPEPKLELSVLAELGVWPAGMDVKQLTIQFETNFVRRQCRVSWQGAEIELAFDLGEVLAGGRCESINEIELELLSGEVAGLKSLSALLQEKLPLQPYNISKAERGYGLLAS